MNKKVLGTALLAGLAIGMGSTAFAATGDTTQGRVVRYDVDSTYTFTIPSDVQLNNGGSSMDVGVSEWDIAANKKLVIGVANTNADLSDEGVLTLKNTAKNTTVQTTVTSSNPGASPTVTAKPGDVLLTINGPAGTTDGQGTKTLYLSAVTGTEQAGTYSAIMTFSASIEDI